MPKTPKIFSGMTAAQLRAATRQYDAEFSGDAFRDMTPAEHNEYTHRVSVARKRGPKPKPVAEKATRVLITLTPDLLAATDDAANEAGMTRADIIADALRRRPGIRDRLKAS
jgi:hypothetical protein